MLKLVIGHVYKNMVDIRTSPPLAWYMACPVERSVDFIDKIEHKPLWFVFIVNKTGAIKD
jgi:hypothetical protein